jgi:hypothetical protein
MGLNILKKSGAARTCAVAVFEADILKFELLIFLFALNFIDDIFY